MDERDRGVVLLILVMESSRQCDPVVDDQDSPSSCANVTSICLDEQHKRAVATSPDEEGRHKLLSTRLFPPKFGRSPSNPKSTE